MGSELGKLGDGYPRRRVSPTEGTGAKAFSFRVCFILNWPETDVARRGSGGGPAALAGSSAPPGRRDPASGEQRPGCAAPAAGLRCPGLSPELSDDLNEKLVVVAHLVRTETFRDGFSFCAF